MLTPEAHAAHLRVFEVDRLIKLVALEAKQHHDGHYTILSFTSGYKVAFGIPDMLPWGGGCGYAQVATMTQYPTLKEALIAALVTGKTFAEYFTGDPATWWVQGFFETPAMERFTLACAEVWSRHA